MVIEDMFGKLKDRFFTRWVACRTVSDKKSVQYGVRFSYPIYILIVSTGILLENTYILLIAALIAFGSIKLPIHPLDYIYNYTIVKLIRGNSIPARGSELQVNSFIALIFNLTVFAFILFNISINYVVLAIIYIFCSIFSICIFLFKD